MFHTNATIQSCYGILEKFLFRNIKIKNSKHVFQRYTDMYFVPFYRLVLKYCLILGWCPYRIRKIKDTFSQKGEDDYLYVPEVVPVEFLNCILVVNKRTIKYEFQFYDEMGMVKKRGVKALIFSDITELANPSLIYSRMSNLLGENRMLDHIKKCVVQSESVRSNPPIYLEEDSKAGGDGATASRTQGYRGGTDSVRAIRSTGVEHWNTKFTDQKTNFENASKDITHNIQFHQQQMSQLMMTHQANYYNLGLGYVPQWYNNQFITPPGYRIAYNPHLPQTSIDPLTMKRDFSSDVYKMFGFPENMVGFLGGAHNVTKGASTKGVNIRKDVNINDINMFDATLDMYKDFFSCVFVLLYKDIFNKIVPLEFINFDAPDMYNKYKKCLITDNFGLGQQQGSKDDGSKKPPSSSSSSEGTSKEGNAKQSPSHAPPKKDDRPDSEKRADKMRPEDDSKMKQHDETHEKVEKGGKDGKSGSGDKEKDTKKGKKDSKDDKSVGDDKEKDTKKGKNDSKDDKSVGDDKEKDTKKGKKDSKDDKKTTEEGDSSDSDSDDKKKKRKRKQGNEKEKKKSKK
jgi:hypothetical protein